VQNKESLLAEKKMSSKSVLGKGNAKEAATTDKKDFTVGRGNGSGGEGIFGGGSSVGGPSIRVKGSVGGGGTGAPKRTLEESLFEGLETMVEEEIEGAIVQVCTEMGVTQKHKETGVEENTTFCLDYFYKKMIKDQLLTGAREFLGEKIGKKKTKATIKEVSEATIFNYKIELAFEEKEVEQFIFWCRSEKQLKFWKKLWYNFLSKVNSNLKLKGYKGSIRYPKGFYAAVDEVYAITHEEGYIEPSKREEEEELPSLAQDIEMSQAS